MGLAASGLQLVQDAVYWRLPRLVRPLVALVTQALIAVADRLTSAESRRDNALVFALVAERPWAIPEFLGAFAAAHPRAVFVEIGANDGAQHDHLRPLILGSEWSGVMVEPVPYIFERLRTNYAGLERVRLENAAIADRDGDLEFFHLVDASEDERRALPSWYDGVGSFSRERVAAHARHIPDIEQRIVRREVPALTFASLRARHGLDRVDLLVIDTEGHDWELLRSIDLAGDPPTVVVYEHFHLGADDRAAAAAHLRACGYRTLEEGFDTLCVHETADPGLLARFAALRPAVAGVSAEDEQP